LPYLINTQEINFYFSSIEEYSYLIHSTTYIKILHLFSSHKSLEKITNHYHDYQNMQECYIQNNFIKDLEMFLNSSKNTSFHLFPESNVCLNNRINFFHYISTCSSMPNKNLPKKNKRLLLTRSDIFYNNQH
jgi:hypothetical protein